MLRVLNSKDPKENMVQVPSHPRLPTFPNTFPDPTACTSCFDIISEVLYVKQI